MEHKWYVMGANLNISRMERSIRQLFETGAHLGNGLGSEKALDEFLKYWPNDIRVVLVVY